VWRDEAAPGKFLAVGVRAHGDICRARASRRGNICALDIAIARGKRFFSRAGLAPPLEERGNVCARYLEIKTL
jgi:hypothetical protein